ncbi:MAG TPA: mandelate racemase/muconate lactonizing enzyme family protein [Bordetella sp.]
MKITAIETIELDAPLEKPWKIATFTLSSLTACLVRIRTDEGIFGIGEAIARFGPGVTAAVVHEILAPVLLGKDPRNIEGLWDAMARTMRPRGHSRGFHLEAMAGVDIALWDLLGQAAGKPVWQLLAGHGRGNIPVYASSILLDTPERMANEARKLVTAGYAAIKVKVGQSARVDAERIEAIRAEVGSGVDLMLDCNSGFEPTDAIQFGRTAERLGIYWMEEPVNPDDLQGYRRVRSALKDVRIAAGEGEFTAGGFVPFLQEGLLDVVQPDIARCSGFTGARRVAALANAFNAAVAPHTGASGPVCIAATMHLSAAIPNFLVFEDMYIHNPLHEVLSVPLPTQAASQIAVPTGPGLGISLNEDALSRFSRQGWRASSLS